MRTSPSQVATIVAVFFSIAAFSLTGCHSSFKMPSAPSWMTWGKKKPTSSLAGKPDTSLPSPSATAMPHQPRGYGQTRGMGSGYGTTSRSPATAGQAGYGTQPGSSQFSPASYGARTGQQPDYGTTGTSPSQRFYSQDYSRGTQSPAYGSGAPSYADKRAPAGSGSTQGLYGSNNYAPSSRAPATGQGWPSNGSGSQYGTSSGATVGDYGYGRTAKGGSTYDRSSYGRAAPATDYRQSPTNYGGTSDGYASPANRQYVSDGSTRAAGALPTSGSAAAPGTYRPGSTSRITPYGDSQDINVAGLRRGVQPTSYGADGSARDAKSFPGSDPAAPGGYGSEGSRTATGQYPTTSPSIYR